MKEIRRKKASGVVKESPRSSYKDEKSSMTNTSIGQLLTAVVAVELNNFFIFVLSYPYPTKKEYIYYLSLKLTSYIKNLYAELLYN